MIKQYVLTILCFLISLSAFADKFEYTYKGVTFKCKTEGAHACITEFDTDVPDVVIPAQVTYQGRQIPVKEVSTFLNGLNYLTINLTLEEGIEVIDKYCFNEFRKLQTVILPSSIVQINKNAFRNNGALRFVMPEWVDEVALRNGKMLVVTPNVPTKSGNEILLAKGQSGQEEQKELDEQAKLLEQRQRELLAQEEKLREQEEKLRKQEARQKKELAEQKKKKGNKGGGLFGSLAKLVVATAADGGSEKEEKTPEVAGNETEDASEAKTSEFAAQEKPKCRLSDEENVDMLIPVTGKSNDNVYCVIIANETYQQVSNVDFAVNDGNSFKEYCQKTLGVPESNIRLFPNATSGQIRYAVNFMEKISAAAQGNARFIFYYAGHGIPDEANKTAYLVPVDGFPSDVTSCYELQELYKRLGKLQAHNVLVFLDACFSGMQRGSGDAMYAARGVAIRPKANVLTGNVVVFSATSNEETALAYQDGMHGMFTYHVLHQLKSSKGNITLGDLVESVKSKVALKSIVVNNKSQTPSISTSAAMRAGWKNIKF